MATSFVAMATATLILLMVEATAEAAPQLIIQIYTMVLDYENIVAIQIVSVVFSFVNLTWAIINYQFHVYDNDKLLANMTPRDRLTIGVCHTFLQRIFYE